MRRFFTLRPAASPIPSAIVPVAPVASVPLPIDITPDDLEPGRTMRPYSEGCTSPRIVEQNAEGGWDTPQSRAGGAGAVLRERASDPQMRDLQRGGMAIEAALNALAARRVLGLPYTKAAMDDAVTRAVQGAVDGTVSADGLSLLSDGERQQVAAITAAQEAERLALAAGTTD